MKPIFKSSICHYISVAFSGAAMAENKQIEIEVLADNCTDVYYETYKEFEALGIEEEATAEAFAAYKDCKGLN
ncbi:hypothetical protein ACNQGB_15965 [Flavobacterium sp. XS1P32]|uniref:hypothetical protein n=1 Tax=unclassified Flavobacterium TaxID=196869 RepID=UPI003AABCA6D